MRAHSTSIFLAFLLAALTIASARPASAQVGIPPRRGPNPDIPLILSSIASVPTLAGDRQGAIVTNRVLANILDSFNEQINCTTCISAFGAIGSFAAGAHGRTMLTEDLSVIGGIAYSRYHSGGVDVIGMPIAAGSLRYDFTELGPSRPYVEAGGILAPFGRANLARNYFGGLSGTGSADTANYGAFGRAGWVYRFSPRDEASVAAEFSRNWQHVGPYSEGLSPFNPVPLINGGGTDQMNIAKFGGQWTHLFGAAIETQINLGVARSFGSRSGLNAIIAGASITPTLGEYTWAEYGLRVGYRIRPNIILDTFLDGTLAGQPIGNTVHGGLAVRYTF